jgi:hypothetical protein
MIIILYQNDLQMARESGSNTVRLRRLFVETGMGKRGKRGKRRN